MRLQIKLFQKTNLKSTLVFLLVTLLLPSEGCISSYKGIDINAVLDYTPIPARDEDIVYIQSVINSDNINQTDDMGRTPLYRACLRGDLNLAKLLIKNGADASKGASWKGNDTPLHVASANGYTEIVKLLISYGVDVNVVNLAGQTPLHYAAWYRHPETLKILISSGADVKLADEYGRTALITLPPYTNIDEDKYKETIRTLIDNGADVNAKTKSNDTPLLRACYAGQKDVIEILLRAGADLLVSNKNGETPLCCILKNKNEEIVKLIPEKLRNHNCKGKIGDVVD